MWFVCLMTLAALVIPLGLILAPYLGYYIPAFDAGGFDRRHDAPPVDQRRRELLGAGKTDRQRP
ncbi:hypothetical protein IscW_ISCW004484 [Ixodes scapularis]|uniref:Uncharacterized protein n=1 Tax=Ixodes scapularis TaxID=6945 RepID=B7PG65_IXOSC|nr:hypothetical protein IscW_ISCW004484 [Ixodes scapularis]|eukprot:XP_002434187.1 hypothetical protein IscW_ISCW004484 [Ixodes scapularis]